ncbi:MAG: hypothetical protein WDO24_11740 [Pseudomonadota bacterium]
MQVAKGRADFGREAAAQIVPVMHRRFEFVAIISHCCGTQCIDAPDYLHLRSGQPLGGVHDVNAVAPVLNYQSYLLMSWRDFRIE